MTDAETWRTGLSIHLDRLCGAQRQRLYSPQMADLAEDKTLTNFVVSAMVNKLGEYDLFTMASMYQPVNNK